jgi:calcium permeable stress-gated cation channel
LLAGSQYAKPLPKNLFGWLSDFFAVPDTVILQHQSLDAYFFLRLLKISVVTCLVGCAITWPILVPVYATGHGGKTQLDAITFGNIGTGKNAWRLYAPAGCAYLLFGFIMLMITRESIFYINMRQAYFMNPAYASKLTSRTVLYVSVPDDYLDEARLREMLGPHATRFWFPGETKELDKLVEERDKAAALLEAAETDLIRTANAQRLKAGELPADPDVENGASTPTADRWITRKQRPSHRLKPVIGKKVDSIEWSREEIARLTPLIEAEQAKHRAGESKKYPAVFVEFDSLTEAQAAYQSLAHHQPLKMSPRYTGIHPLDVIWGNLKIGGWERFIRQTLTVSAVVITVIYWSVPVAFIGVISNINYWIGPHGKTPWLNWLQKIPSVIFGVVTGLLPVVLLAVLMALLPPYLRRKYLGQSLRPQLIDLVLSKLGGCPTLADVEYTVSNYYFAFQVVQVFLVTTLSSAVSGSVINIINKPSSAISILASSVPSANNFYLSYMVLQGLGVVSGMLASVAGLIVTPLLARLLGSTPRKLFLRWNTLSSLSYGTVYPIYTNLLVIGKNAFSLPRTSH